jgi:hypothetical protein
MNIYEELCKKFLDDLQAGVRVPRKINGDWLEERIPYQQSLKGYCKNPIIKKVFLWKYKSLDPIESFSSEEKKEWKKYVNEIFPGTPPQFRLDAVKIIYTIGNLTS